MIPHDPMRSWDLHNLTGADCLKPIIHKLPPKNNRVGYPRTVLVRPTIADVTNFQRLQKVLRPLTVDGSYPTWAGVVRAVMRVALVVEEVDPGFLVRFLEGERLPKFPGTSLPHPRAITAIETDSAALAEAREVDDE